ncbi:AbrB/MazE/SpoVT family DNA-binding domain-containing protein [Tissierella praeacuta]|uniref:AbrB/MazE/SpoVT family DNA-binding domain-containing protein n=1 Tax=Tissierella praeacuta TaxID=43131 RepID=UPI0028AAF55B|nr:AbrB/MazE/SpoVT family DNA-binding domain-containing protein [Tissierella praeacuta]
MEHTGIVRRVDELGRVVIPKEIRRTLRIREGDPLEISVDLKNVTISIKKYHPEKVFDFEDEELEEIIAGLKERIKDRDIIIRQHDLTESSQITEDEILKYKQSRYLCRTIINKINEIVERGVNYVD